MTDAANPPPNKAEVPGASLDQGEQSGTTQGHENDGALKLLAAVAELNQAERERFIAAMAVLNDTGGVETEPAEEELLEHIAAWYAEIPQTMSTRERYRLLAETREQVQTEIEAGFLDEQMALIRRENKKLAFEMAVVNYAYHAPVWTIIGGLGLVVLAGRLVFDASRGLFRIWF